MNVVLNHSLNKYQIILLIKINYLFLPSITLRIRRVIAELAGGGTP
jgi:hypothetical protein